MYELYIVARLYEKQEWSGVIGLVEIIIWCICSLKKFSKVSAESMSAAQ